MEFRIWDLGFGLLAWQFDFYLILSLYLWLYSDWVKWPCIQFRWDFHISTSLTVEVINISMSDKPGHFSFCVFVTFFVPSPLNNVIPIRRVSWWGPSSQPAWSFSLNYSGTLILLSSILMSGPYPMIIRGGHQITNQFNFNIFKCLLYDQWMKEGSNNKYCNL